MPALSDRGTIRTILETDRLWSVYALGDLGPGRFEHCSWFAPDSGIPALVLLYRAFSTPVLFTLGEPPALAPLLNEVRGESCFYLQIRPVVVPLLEPRYRIRECRRMWRMALEPGNYRPPSAERVTPLGPADLGALQRLYADGDGAGEAPDFFFPSMLEEGAFFGVREGDELVAAAGTHLVAPEEQVAAIGNVYTRRDRRGRGLAARVTAAVVEALLRLGVRTIGLNVRQENAAAIRVYERLGFVRYCEFYEGLGALAHQTVHSVFRFLSA